MAITISGDSPNLTSASLTTPTLTSPTFAGTPSGSIITSMTAQASTSGTAISFTSIPSWVKRITVMFNGVSTNGTSIVQIQIGSSSYTTTGYTGSGSLLLNPSTLGVANNSTGFLTSSASEATYVRQGFVVLSNITGNTWVASGVIGQSDSARINLCGGALSLSGVLDRVQVTTVNGTDTFDAGSINILYE
jgi:hypothetical protein